MAQIAVAVVGLILSSRQQKRARQESRRAREAQEVSEKLRTRKDVLQQVRNAQIARAKLTQQAANQGVSGASSVAGAQGAIQSTAAGNIGFAQSLFNLQQESRNRLARADKLRGSAQAFGQFASLVGNFNSSPSAPAPVETSVAT